MGPCGMRVGVTWLVWPGVFDTPLPLPVFVLVALDEFEDGKPGGMLLPPPCELYEDADVYIVCDGCCCVAACEDCDED